MEKRHINAVFGRIIDTLAAIEHERWSHWQRYMHEKGKVQADGSLLIPTDLFQRWERQIVTPYAALSEDEKESDRDQVRRYLTIIAEALAGGTDPDRCERGKKLSSRPADSASKRLDVHGSE